MIVAGIDRQTSMKKTRRARSRWLPFCRVSRSFRTASGNRDGNSLFWHLETARPICDRNGQRAILPDRVIMVNFQTISQLHDLEGKELIPNTSVLTNGDPKDRLLKAIMERFGGSSF
jgi:hypothetical protein